MNAERDIKILEQIFEMGGYTIVARECLIPAEQILRHMIIRDLPALEKKDQLKVQKTIDKIGKGNLLIQDFTMGQLVGFLRESRFLDAWELKKNKDASGFRVIDLNRVVAFRNQFVHEGRDATKEEAEILLKWLKICIKLFGNDDDFASILPDKFERRSVSKNKAFLIGVSVVLFIVLVGIILYLFLPNYQKNQTSPCNAALINTERLNQFNPAAQKALQIAYSEKFSAPAPKTAIAVMTRPRETQADSKWRELKDGGTLSSQDIYKIMFSPESPAFVYVIQIDSRGKLDWLFPKNPTSAYSSGQSPVSANQWTQVPAEDAAFHLDDTTGIEHLYVIVTKSRWIELEKALIAPFHAPHQNRPIQMAMNLKTRGVGGTVKAPMLTDELVPEASENVRVMMEGRDGVLVFEKWFDHVREK